MLTTRQAELLRYVVADYIETVNSVSSAGLVKSHGLNLSPATVRNEFAELEAAGYLFRPHTSAGVVPTERAYRLYVETVAGDMELTEAQRSTIRHQFHQVERDAERWIRLAAATLAQAATALALVTPLRAAVSRLQAVELVPLGESRGLVILVLRSGQIRRATLHVPETMTPDELETMGHRLTARYKGMERARVAKASRQPGSALEAEVLETVLSFMVEADQELAEEPYLYGFQQVLRQPEFADSGLIRGLLEAVDSGRLVPALRPLELSSGQLRVIIGEEHWADFLRPYGVVVAAYGGVEGRGTVAVLGPMRMAYAAAVPSVRYLAQILTELAEEPAHPNE